MSTQPTLWMIAGPNGAGKTTFTMDYVPQIADCHHFINADLIAAGLAPLAPASQLMAASRIFLAEIQTRIAARQSFAIETTLAGRTYLRLIQKLRSEGWRVELIYLALPDLKMSQMRVAERVAHGGHDIPFDDLKRRFPRSLRSLLSVFGSRTDYTECYMNDGDEPGLGFIQSGETRTVLNESLFRLLEKGADE